MAPETVHIRHGVRQLRLDHLLVALERGKLLEANHG